ncbi:MAG: glutathione peroxidase [Zoogloea sp.]|nr:glutathione peroxidase [Zoogloea sp.]
MSAIIHEFEARTLGGQPLPLADYAGKVLLIVNTASRCGFTPQYAGLQKLHETYAGRGLAVLGFPCNQFGAQEPGSPEEIGAFCQMNYGVSFPIAEKVEVNGPDAHPLFHYLTEAAPGVLGTRSIKWNFTKFLVDRSGQVVARYAPNTPPESLSDEIERLLALAA